MSAEQLAAARAERAARFAAHQAAAAAAAPPPVAPSEVVAESAAAEAAVPSAVYASALACIELSGERDRMGTHKVVEVDCRLWDTAWRPAAAGSRIMTLHSGEGKLHDTPATTEAERERNVRFLTESARRIQQARARGEAVWVHCTEGINRGPAGLMAYLLLHTELPSLKAVFRLVKSIRSKARTQSNTFAAELEVICRTAGKPLA